jgi:hypothetical protein
MRNFRSVLESIVIIMLWAFPASAAVDCETTPEHPKCVDSGGSNSGIYQFFGFTTVVSSTTMIRIAGSSDQL